MHVDPKYEESGKGGALCRHVDGDLLAKWLDEGGVVEDLVKHGEDMERDVEALFGELVRGVEGLGGGDVDVDMDVDVDVDGSGRGEAVRMWLAEVLRPVL